MKIYLLIFFCLLKFTSFSQLPPADFSAIDKKTATVKSASPEILAKELTAFCKNDLEKVRSIFRWIADNIDYKTRQPSNRKGISVYNEADDNAPLKSLDERVAEMVLQKGFAVCDGYSRLFKTLCTYAGIKAETINGYARVNKNTRRFGNNHTWNAVMVDNRWQLLDVTWASGYISWTGDNFIRHFDEAYFLSSPDKFILEHYPDDLSWSLMEKPPLLAEFRSSPFKQKTYSKYKITAYKPAGGIIEVNQGDTLQIQLETANAEKDRSIGSDPFLNLASFSTFSSEVLSPVSVDQNKISYTYNVTSPAIEWLYIQYNNDVILRYRLVVKNGKPGKELAVK